MTRTAGAILLAAALLSPGISTAAEEKKGCCVPHGVTDAADQ